MILSADKDVSVEIFPGDVTFLNMAVVYNIGHGLSKQVLRFPLHNKTRSVDTPCLTHPTWSYFIQDKLEISYLLVIGQV